MYFNVRRIHSFTATLILFSSLSTISLQPLVMVQIHIVMPSEFCTIKASVQLTLKMHYSAFHIVCLYSLTLLFLHNRNTID